MSTILQHIHDDEAVELTRQLIRIPSLLWRESAIGRWLAGWMSQRGYDVELQEVPLRDGNVTHQAIGALRGDGSGPSLMLCGHTDTSDWNGDVFRREQWRYDPFGAEIDGGMIYGLGALNMKAGLASMLIAAEAIRRSGAPLKGDLIVACVVAETGGGVGALHLIESGCRSRLLHRHRGGKPRCRCDFGWVCTRKDSGAGRIQAPRTLCESDREDYESRCCLQPLLRADPTDGRWRLAALSAASADSRLSFNGDPQHRALSGCDDGRL